MILIRTGRAVYRLIGITFSSNEKVVLSWSSKLMFSLTTEMSCLFSSQVPSPSFLEDNLKFVEVHHAFLRHC